MESFDIPTSVTINYTDIMAELSGQFINLYAIFAVIVLIYTLMNMFVFEVKDWMVDQILEANPQYFRLQFGYDISIT